VRDLKEGLNAESNLKQLITLLSNAKEFAGLPVRHNEDTLNRALNDMVEYSCPIHEMGNPHVKACLLLQAHFSKLPMPISDYITDTKSVLDQAIRVVQAMIDICAKQGYYSTTQ
jgi:activating signal cointegrator complex subunit 3